MLTASGTAVRPNPFVETTLSYALTYVSRLAQLSLAHSFAPCRLTILADNDYYSQRSAPAPSSTTPGRFARVPTTLSGANKTGLGSSAALVTALTAAVLSYYLPPVLFDLATDAGKDTLHNLAQAAHCAAQGKVGSGFDVAAAVYGSCTYRRFSPSVLASIPESGRPGFGDALLRVVGGGAASASVLSSTDRSTSPTSVPTDDSSATVPAAVYWDTEIAKNSVALPAGVAVRMCDVDCGSQTVGMVKKVLAWRSGTPEASKALWDSLQAANEKLAAALRDGETAKLPGQLEAVRALVREMGTASNVPIEPESQTALLDALTRGVEGVYGGVVPGAGGYDAVALLVRDDEATAQRLTAFLETWSKDTGARVRLLGVKGEMEGVRREDKGIYDGWLYK